MPAAAIRSTNLNTLRFVQYKKYYIWFLNTERSWLGRGFPTRKALNSINTSWRSKGTPPQPAFINFSWNKAKLSSADVSDIEKVAHKEEVPLFKKINGLITVAYDGDWWLESLLDKTFQNPVNICVTPASTCSQSDLLLPKYAQYSRSHSQWHFTNRIVLYTSTSRTYNMKPEDVVGTWLLYIDVYQQWRQFM